MTRKEARDEAARRIAAEGGGAWILMCRGEPACEKPPDPPPPCGQCEHIYVFKECRA